MSARLLIIGTIRQKRAALSALLARRWKNSFYIFLAALFTLFTVADAAFLHATAEMRQAAFDAMARYRIIVPEPDPDPGIVIMDINEASLAAMAKDYGRWPWPRQVLGEFTEQLEKRLYRIK